jgi:adiponectin receptor
MSSNSNREIHFTKNNNDKPLETFEVEIKENIIENNLLIGTFEEAPDYLKDNEYIKTGYLLNCDSVKKSIISLFKCHNELMNIWSHLLGTLFAFFLVFYTTIYITSYHEKDLSKYEYEKMVIDIKEVIFPWIEDLKIDKNIEKYFNPPIVSTYIEKIILKTESMFKKINFKKKISKSIINYIEEINDIIKNIKDKLRKKTNSKILDNITLKWEIINNKIMDILHNKKTDNESISNNNNKKLRRWPLFIMLFAAIFCLGCSTIFHLFGPLSKNLFSILNRLDYAGISFLITGSCFPPYYYFFYCEGCKNIFLKK